MQLELAAGRSIESLAREVGRDPSTVSYWVRKLGLRSAHADRHAPRGGLAHEVLAPLVAEGASTREIAEALGVSQSTVRHWLKRHGLQTRRSAQRAERVVPEGDSRRGVCAIHGETEFRMRPDGYWRCLPCRSLHVADRRRRIKQILVEEAGGACVVCGYDRSARALHFHHVDPADKRFQLSYGGFTRAIEAARAEAAKCVLLCANCHAEVEGGIATLGPHPDPSPG